MSFNAREVELVSLFSQLFNWFNCFNVNGELSCGRRRDDGDLFSKLEGLKLFLQLGL